MTTLFRRPMLVLGTTILVMQAVFMPAGMVYAETTMDTEEQELMELPPMKNYLEEKQISDARFFFTRSRMQGTAEAPLQVTFFSDQEVSEASVFLPEEATLLKDQLQTGISVTEGALPNEWVVQSKHAQNTFVLPLVFEVAGMYEVAVTEDTMKIEICDHEKTQRDEDDSMEEKSDQDYATDYDLSHQKNSEDRSTRSWNINSFPLIINSQNNELLRPELIPDIYHSVQASNSSLPSGFGWMRASDRSPMGSGILQNIKYIFPDIVQDNTGNNLDLFFDVTQNLNISREIRPGTMFRTHQHSGVSFTADVSLEDSNGELVEEPIHFYTSHVGYLIRIKKDDLLGMELTSNVTSLNVRESEDYYTIQPNAASSIGWIVKNGAQIGVVNSTSTSAGFHMFSSRPSTSALKDLAFESFPIEGGSAGSDKASVFQGETVSINASPNPGYQFTRWEIVSGSGAMIEDLESANTNFTMGSSNTVIRAVFEEIKYKVILESNPLNGGIPEVETPQLSSGEKTVIRANPNHAYDFVRWEIIHGEDSVIDDSFNSVTNVTMGTGDTTIRAVYEIKVVSPVDPLDPEVEVDPENKPELPENQGQLSIDFISAFNFGSQAISAHDQTYYAQPQRLLNEDGTVNENEERPNYVQISDRRPENDRNGWELAVTQKEQFKGEENQVLNGASLSLSNQQVVTVQGGTAPGLQSVPCDLIPGQRRTLLKAQGNEGTGTWIYRFGDGETASESVALTVPRGATPAAKTYKSILTWELSAVPGN